MNLSKNCERIKKWREFTWYIRPKEEATALNLIIYKPTLTLEHCATKTKATLTEEQVKIFNNLFLLSKDGSVGVLDILKVLKRIRKENHFKQEKTNELK